MVAVVVGADRIRLFESWFSFGMDKKFKIYGGYWMHQDALPQMDDRAIGMIGNSLHYAAGLDTPANKAFVDAFAKKHKRLPSWFSESAYTASLWTRTAIEQIKGNVEDRAAFLKAMRAATDRGAARHAQDGRLRQPDPERLHDAHPEDQSSVGGPGADQRSDQDLRERLAVLDLDAGGVPQARSLQAVSHTHRRSGGASRRRRPHGAAILRGRHRSVRLMHSGILQAINGVSFAALLFLLASGFTLSFGLMRVVNMAHGAYYLFGGYIGLTITRSTGSFALGVLGGGLAVIPLGYLIDRFLIRRTGENHLAQVLLTVGIAFVLGDVALKIWGGDNLKVPTPIALRGAIELPGGIIYPTYRFVLIVFGMIVGLSLWLLYRKTQIGAVVRAGVDDREIVSAIGINIDRLFVLVSALASFLAGMAGVVGGAFLTLYPGAEWEILVYALVVVIFGGLGSLEGAMIGALIVGLLDAYGRWLLPEFSYFVLFGPMAILLLFRPRGIFGREG